MVFHRIGVGIDGGMVVMVSLVMVMVVMTVTVTFGFKRLTELAHFAVHLHLSELGFNFPIAHDF